VSITAGAVISVGRNLVGWKNFKALKTATLSGSFNPLFVRVASGVMMSKFIVAVGSHKYPLAPIVVFNMTVDERPVTGR
jgi:hypothetical protein